MLMAIGSAEPAILNATKATEPAKTILNPLIEDVETALAAGFFLAACIGRDRRIWRDRGEPIEQCL
jgi:hypothetical protein